MISIEEFKRIELRIGEITAAETIPGSDRLLKLTVDLGEERRTLVGGLAKCYQPAELCGLQVVVAANLAPAWIKGVESQGMLLGVGCGEETNIGLLTVNRRAPTGALVA
jgi:methionine--tRNA ligase beta chain